MNAHDIRCQNDLDMYQALLENADVKRVNDLIARQHDQGPSGLRRRLLATSVRLSRGMAPQIQSIADGCIEQLAMEIPLELYVFASPSYNAMCFKPEDGRLFVMFSSSLLEAFDEDEIRFVMGHELGHHVYRHHDIPVGYLMQSKQADPKLALELFAWSRYAEISADRAGAHCAKNFHAVASSLFKLASGLTGKRIAFNLDEFLAQLGDMRTEDQQPGQGAPKEDWFSTHPFSPLRVKALELFNRSELAVAGGMTKADLEVGTQGLLSLMEPSYLEGQTDTARYMRRVLFAGAIAVADATDGIDEHEVAIFEQFFGKGEFKSGLDIDLIKSQLDDRIKKVVEHASMPQRMQVIRDLCVIAKANNIVSQEERDVLIDIAQKMSVATQFIDQSLEQDTDIEWRAPTA